MALSGKPGRIEIQLSNFDASKARAAHSTPNLPAGKYVELTVKDDGSGMDEETLQHVFEPFFTTKKPGEGTGLGLSVVHGIVKDHEGILHVDSERNVGSTFYIWFPVFSDDSPELETGRQAPLIPGNGERILFIDDEPADIQLASNFDLEVPVNAGTHGYLSTGAGFDVRLGYRFTIPYQHISITPEVAIGYADLSAQFIRLRPGFRLGFGMAPDAEQALLQFPVRRKPRHPGLACTPDSKPC